MRLSGVINSAKGRHWHVFRNPWSWRVEFMYSFPFIILMGGVYWLPLPVHLQCSEFNTKHSLLNLPGVSADAYHKNTTRQAMYTRVNKYPSAWNFLSPKPKVTCGTVAIIIRVVLLSPYLRIRAVSLSSVHYNQSHRVYINRRRQYICLIWN